MHPMTIEERLKIVQDHYSEHTEFRPSVFASLAMDPAHHW